MVPYRVDCCGCMYWCVTDGHGRCIRREFEKAECISGKRSHYFSKTLHIPDSPAFPVYINGLNYDSVTQPYARYSTHDCDAVISAQYAIDRLNREKEKNEMKPKTDLNQEKIYFDRNDYNDRAIFSLSLLEPNDVFRFVTDETKTIFMVIDMPKDKAEKGTVYYVDLATGTLCYCSLNDKVSNSVYVYDKRCIKFSFGNFISEADATDYK